MSRSNSYGICILIIYISFFYDAKAVAITPSEKDVEKTVTLTQMINNGNINEARKMSKVVHPELSNYSSYAGYFTVNETYDSNMYFWFFEAQKDTEKAPVILYLSGGPGTPFTLNVFFENGPFTVDENMSLQAREYSWHKIANVLYIDNPVGTGYSYTNDSRGYANNEVDVGINLLSALKQFFRLFPRLRKNPFYAAGVSYAGKYVPAVAKAIKDYNNLQTDVDQQINLQGMLIANGWTDPINQINYGDYLYQIGLIDVHGLKEFKNYESQIKKFIDDKDYRIASVLASMLLTDHAEPGPTVFSKLTGLTDYYHYGRPSGSFVSKFTVNYNDWLQRPDVQQALHVASHVQSQVHAKNTTFEDSVTGHLMSDIVQSEANVMADLLENYRVLIFTGQLDIVTNYPSVVKYLQNLKWTGAEKYETAERKIWKVDNEVAGYTKTADKLTEVLVRNAGHSVCADQPKYTFDLIKRFINNRQF